MNLMDYARIVLRRGWIMLLLAALTAGGAYYLAKQQTEIFRATQKVLISPSRNDFGLQQTTANLLYSYAEYLDSELVAQKVIDTLQLDMQAAALKENVFIVPDTLRLFIQIDVNMEDGELANRIANEWGNELIRFRDEDNARLRREDQVLARIQDVPRYGLYAPRPLINAAAGGVLGLLLGAVIVFMMEYLESAIVRRRDDLERVLEIPVLAAIPDVER